MQCAHLSTYIQIGDSCVPVNLLSWPAFSVNLIYMLLYSSIILLFRHLWCHIPLLKKNSSQNKEKVENLTPNFGDDDFGFVMPQIVKNLFINNFHANKPTSSRWHKSPIERKHILFSLAALCIFVLFFGQATFTTFESKKSSYI